MKTFTVSSGLRAALIAAAGLFVSSIAFAGTIVGRVATPGGEPASDARITVAELRRSVFAEPDGSFVFENVPPGEYHLQAISSRFGSRVEEIVVGQDEVRVDLVLEVSVHRESIVVTAPRSGTASGEVAVPVHVLEKNELEDGMQATIGDTLVRQPGVNTTYFGPGSSRPVLRGQGGARIRVLESGLGTMDASTTSPDHAVTFDPLSAERVEIVRGPATLIYGSTAIGGVVNLIDTRVPEYVPQRKVGGSVNLRAASVSDEFAGAAGLDGGVGSFAWHLDASRRETGDYSIPGNAVLGDPSSPSGTLPNSSLETSSGTVGASWVGGSNFVGLAARRFETNYGVPGEDVRIDMEQDRYELRGEINTDYGPFTGVQFRLASVDYRHVELADGAIGTTFLQDGWEGRVDLPNGGGGKVSGVVGLQFGFRDLETIGAESFVPPNETQLGAVFAHEEVRSGSMRYGIGLRYERQENRVRDPGLPDRDFDAPSASFAVSWVPGERYTVGLHLARATRPPSAEALYSFGPHEATRSFEIGDPSLSEEISYGVDVSLRKREGRLTGELNLFANRYDDFIYESPTGAVMDGLPVFEFVQDDADFRGYEVNLVIETWRATTSHLDVVLMSDYTRAELRSTGDPLPFIPPLRYGLDVRYSSDRWRASVGVLRNQEQDRVPSSGFVTPTPGSTVLSATVGYRFLTRGVVHDLLLRGANLTNEDIRVATSRLKDEVPAPGRDISLNYRLTF